MDLTAIAWTYGFQGLQRLLPWLLLALFQYLFSLGIDIWWAVAPDLLIEPPKTLCMPD